MTQQHSNETEGNCEHKEAILPSQMAFFDHLCLYSKKMQKEPNKLTELAAKLGLSKLYCC